MRLLVAIAALAVCPALIGPAHATTVNDFPNMVQAPGTQGPCAIFQVSSLNETFVVPTSDANYEDEFALLSTSQVLGIPITFTDAGSTISNCQGYELAQNIQVGNTQCATGYTFDFTAACDVVAIWTR